MINRVDVIGERERERGSEERGSEERGSTAGMSNFFFTTGQLQI